MATIERDVWAAAAMLARRYGADAAWEAGRRVYELRAGGDIEGQGVGADRSERSAGTTSR